MGAFEDAADYLQSLDRLDTPQHTRRYVFENGVARARNLLLALGGAPATLARCVVVTGSKGKGSTAMMIASVLAAAGHRVGAFTGPHLHTPLERFMLLDGRAGSPPARMDEPDFVDFASRIRRAVDDWQWPGLGAPTRFEAYAAMACRWFEEHACDIAILEVGIGGRHDAANLGEPVVSVFTNISLEHTQMLGDTVEQIAREKAGIMRANGHAVSAWQTPEVEATLREEAANVRSPITFAPRHWRVQAVSEEWSAHRAGQWLSCARADDSQPLRAFLPLLGDVQWQNAACALTALDVLRARGWDSGPAAIRAGFAAVSWPGRFEVLQELPLVIADGAHTPYSMHCLAAALRRYFPRRRLHFVLGVLRDKDARGILDAVAGAASTLVFARVQHRRAVPADDLLALCEEMGFAGGLHARVAAGGAAGALRLALDGAASEDVVCVTGSLHLVAETHSALAGTG